MDRTADDEGNWETATWEGSRRVQLRAALRLSVRERLEALEDLAELSQRLAAMPRSTTNPGDANPGTRKT